MLAAILLLQQRDGGGSAAAGGQHGIYDKHLTLRDVGGHLAVVFHGQMGVGVAVQTDVAHLGGGNQINDGVHHAQTGPQDGHDGQLFAGQHAHRSLGHGRFNFHLFGGQIPGSLIAHELCDFAYQLPKFLDAGVLIPQQSQLVLDQGMLQYV